jgi:hypothetical protein
MTKYVSVISMGLLFSAADVSAVPFFQISESEFVVKIGATDCKGPIASEKHPIVGEKLTGKLRREGRLPDTFVCGRCRYDLRGDPGAAYYIKDCH